MKRSFLKIAYQQELLNKLRTLNDEVEIENLLRYLLDFYNLLNFNFHYSEGIWRARICQDKMGFPSLSEILTPPKELVTAGRLNEEKQPILYASINNHTALKEVGAKEGDYVQIVAFQISKDKKLKSCIIGETRRVHLSGSSILGDSLAQPINTVLKEIPNDAATAFVFLDAIFSEILSDRQAHKNQYIYSRILAKLIRESQKDVDAIIYPSVAHDGALNIAINPDLIGNQITIGANFVVKVNKVYDYGIYDTTIVRRAEGHYSNGIVNWTSPL